MSGGLQSPGALAHLAHLDIPRPESPGGSRGPSSDFATGYSLGLIGGVRSWVRLSFLGSLTTANNGIDDSKPRLSAWQPTWQW